MNAYVECAISLERLQNMRSICRYCVLWTSNKKLEKEILKIPDVLVDSGWHDKTPHT